MSAPPSRIVWLDTARGLGIVLVVVGHAMGGLIDSPLGGGLAGIRLAFFAIYTFHMPLFFMLAGLLVEPRIERGRGSFLWGLLRTLVWPYLLWSVVQFTVIWAMGPLVNRPAGPWLATVLALPWRPVSQFWFLQALVCCHGLAALALPRIGREGLLILGLIVRPLAFVLPLDPVLRLIVINFAWYALGLWLGLGGLQRLVVDRAPWVRGAALPLIGAGVVGAALGAVATYAPDLPLLSATSPQIASLAWRLPAGGAALGGALAVVALASLPPFALGGLLPALGRRAMPVYLLHVLFVAGARIVLVRMGLADPALLLPLLIAAGLAGPLVAARMAKALGLARPLGLG